MEKSISIRKFIKMINRFPVDEPIIKKGVWYRTQKEHWLGWLRHYHTPGAYNRQGSKNQDAKFFYNHIVNPEMLLYLIKAIPLKSDLIQAAEKAYLDAGKTMMAKSGAIRKVVSWSIIYNALWGKKD